MSKDSSASTDPAPMLEAWLKTSAQFWEFAAAMAPELQGADGEPGPQRRAMESWKSTMKTMQALSAVMAEPHAMEGVLKGVNTMPDAMLKVLTPAWEGIMRLQTEMVERAGRIGQSTQAYSFDSIEQDAFKAWLEVYEKEFRQFLKAPPLGLTRVYQERINDAADKFNVFQATMAEFVSVMTLPIEKSFKVMQDHVAELVDDGKLPQSGADFYGIWVKILEGHYMTLFKSPEYGECLSRTLDAYSDFKISRQQILQDMLSTLPVPTMKDMDELYKEIYTLKKKVKELEKKSRNGDPDDED